MNLKVKFFKNSYIMTPLYYSFEIEIWEKYFYTYFLWLPTKLTSNDTDTSNSQISVHALTVRVNSNDRILFQIIYHHAHSVLFNYLLIMLC